ncbi:hypothetical protein NKDENANG_01157 [Candidatus Entotheonellaceae bacterium PAL068K]
MQRFVFNIGTCVILLCGVVFVQAIDAQPSGGPLGLRWGMPKEAVEQLDIRLCCRQVGKWGARYKVNSQDFTNFPKPLGDEETVYLYFGNTNKLLRVYVAIRKIDGQNRYRQINIIVDKKYDFIKSCIRKKYTKYEALRLGKSEEVCKDYEGYTEYAKNNIEVFVGLERYSTDYRVSLILLNRKIHEIDKSKNNPL